MKKVHLAVVLVSMSMVISGNVLATGTTDWFIGAGGTVSYDGAQTITGTGLPVNLIAGIGTGSTSGLIAPITDGVLSFSDSTSPIESLGTLTWGAGGTLSVTGSFQGGGNITLLTDDFESLTIAPLGSTSFQVTIGQIQGTIDPSVANYFGVTQSFTASSLQLALDDGSGFPGAFTSNNLGGTINAVDAAEHWSFFTSLLFFTLIGSVLVVLTRARVLRVALPA